MDPFAIWPFWFAVAVLLLMVLAGSPVDDAV